MILTPSLKATSRELLVVAALFVVVTAGVMWPLLGVMSSHFPGGVSDAKLNAWILAWGADRVPHALSGFWTPPIFYPYPNTLAHTENLLGIAAIVAPVQWIFGNPNLTYNVAFLLSFVVSGVTSYLLAREITGSKPAALVAAFGFVFAPYRWAQMTHLHVMWTAWLPLALWALHRALRDSKWPYWILCAAALLLQVLSNSYSAFQAALAMGLVGCAGVYRYGIDRASLRRLATVAVVMAILFGPTILAYYQVWSTRQPTPGDLTAYSADLTSYLNVDPALPDAKWLPGLSQDEGHLFPGLIVLTLVLVALAPVRGSWPVTKWRWVYAVMALLAILVSLGPDPRAWGQPLPIPGVYAWLSATVPLFEAMRVPARFGIIAILACSVLAGIGASRVLTFGRATVRYAVAAALCALILYEGFGARLPVLANFIPRNEGDAEAYAWLATQPPGALLNLPMSTLGTGFALTRQYGALKHRHPVVDGVGRIDTPLVEWLSGSGSPLVVTELRPHAVSFLRGLGVRYILLRQGEFNSPDIAAHLIETLSQDSGVVERGRFGAVTAWEITPGVPTPDDGADLSRIAPENLSLSASDNPARTWMAVDGNSGTRWLTGRPQDGSEWVEVYFDRPRTLSKIEFVLHPRSTLEFARVLEVVAAGTLSGAPETVLFRGPLLEALGRGWLRSPHHPRISLTVPATMTRRVLLRQRGSAAPWIWSIDELVLWERR